MPLRVLSSSLSFCLWQLRTPVRQLHDLACIFANRRTGVLMRAPGHGRWLVARLSSDAHHPMQGHVQILRFVLSAPHPPSDHFVLNAPRHPLDRDATFRPHPRALILAPLARAETSSATHLWGAIGTGAHRVGNQKLKTNLYTLSIPCKLFFIFQPTSIFCRNHNSGLCVVCTAPVLVSIRATPALRSHTDQ